MLVFGICAGPSDKAERLTIPSIERTHPDAEVIIVRGYDSIFVAYNEIMRQARESDGVSGLVLMHDDTELLDALSPEVNALLEDESTGIIGAIGGKAHPRMFWWGGEKYGHVKDNQHGSLHYSEGVAEVDTVDGLILILGRSALAELSFDSATYGRAFHGYDADLCAQARDRGLRVLVADIDMMHHNNVERPLGDVDMLYICDAKYRLKWRRLPLAARMRLRGRILRRQTRRSLPEWMKRSA